MSQSQQTSRVHLEGSIAAIGIYLVPVLTLVPLLYHECVQLWERPHMQFFPLAFGFAAWFIWQQVVQQKTTINSSLPAPVFVVPALMLTIAAHLAISPWLAHVSLVCWIATWVFDNFSKTVRGQVFGTIALLLVTIPAPLDSDRILIQFLQTMSSIFCGRILDIVGIVHVRLGNTIEIANKQLFVAEACSGIDSLYSLLAFGMIYCLWKALAISSWMSLLLLAPLWGMIGNVLRILTIVLGLEWGNFDLSIGTPHTLLGLGVFLVSTVGLIGIVQLVDSWLVGKCEPLQIKICRAIFFHVNGFWFPRLPRRPCLAIVTTLSISVLLFSTFVSTTGIRSMQSGIPRLAEPLVELFPGEEALPFEVNELHRIRFSTERRDLASLVGQCSRTWLYSDPQSNESLISLDFPFSGWHPLEVCYKNAGWTVDSISRVELNSPKSDQQWSAVELYLSRGDLEYGMVIFSLFDAQGHPVQQEAMEDLSLSQKLWNRTKSSFRKLFASDPTTFQFQIMSCSDRPLQPAQLERQRQIYVDTFEKIYDAISPALESFRKQ